MISTLGIYVLVYCCKENNMYNALDWYEMLGEICWNIPELNKMKW